MKIMLAMKKDNAEERNSHLKHTVFILAAVIVLGALPNIIFGITGFDLETQCSNDGEQCLDEDDFLGELVGNNLGRGLFYYQIGIAFIGIVTIAYKLGQA